MSQQPVETAPVLIVDDDALVRRLLTATLTRAGFRTEEAAGGAEALELLRRRPFAAVLLDNNMPGMSGLEVLERLRREEDTRTLPVLLVTGDDEVSARVRGLQQGASDYVSKPFHPDELVARLRAQLREQAAWTEVVERRLAERTSIANALFRTNPAASAEATAEVVCAQVQELRHLAGSALLAFLDDGMVVPLAVQGPGPWGVERGVPLPSSLARNVRTRAATGPWLQRRNETVACAPLGGQLEPLGLLTLTAGATAPAGPAADAQLLAAAIDFASVAAGLVTPSLLSGGDHGTRLARLSETLRRQAFAPVFQPIVSLGDGRVIGFEALTRFEDGTRPQLRFAEAAALDRGMQLETATLAAAVHAARALPEDAWLSVNVSPTLVVREPGLRDLLAECPLPVVLELTEHDPVDDYAELQRALARLRPEMKVSVDDAGSGFASLRHVLALQPDFVKLDQSWVTGIHADPARQALVAGLCHFAAQTRSLLIAEGIETDRERGKLEELDVDLGQGFLFGAPAPAG